MADQRRYTVDEIDRMRAALIRRYPIREVMICKIGFFDQPAEPSEETHRRRAERAAIVESQLQTYMLNGIDPEELAVTTSDLPEN